MRGSTCRLMDLDLCWFTKRLHFTQLQWRNLDTQSRDPLVPGTCLPSEATPQPLPLPSQGASGALAIQRSPYLSDCTDKGTSAFSL